VRPPYRCGGRHLHEVLQRGLVLTSGPPIDGEAWGTAPISRRQPSLKSLCSLPVCFVSLIPCFCVLLWLSALIVARRHRMDVDLRRERL
jgi:hypothetical protein